MANSSLRSQLDALASTFADEVLRAIRSASIEDLQAESGAGRVRGVGTMAGNQGPRARTTKSGRLRRRSDEEITKTVDQVVALVKKNKAGLRAEEIKKALHLDVREMPRVLRTAVAHRKLKRKGQKRATVYSAR